MDDDGEAERPGAEIMTAVRARLDAVADLVDIGKYHEARESLYGRRWSAGLDLGAVPTYTRERLEQWIGVAHEGLTEIPVDPRRVQNLLLQARRTIAR